MHSDGKEVSATWHAVCSKHLQTNINIVTAVEVPILVGKTYAVLHIAAQSQQPLARLMLFKRQICDELVAIKGLQAAIGLFTRTAPKWM